MILEHDAAAFASGFEETVAEAMRAITRAASPVLASIKHITVSHFSDPSPRPAQRNAPYHSQLGAAENFTIARATMESGDAQSFVSELERVAHEMARQVMTGFYAGMDEMTSDIGNVVDAKGRPLSADLFCELLEKIEIEFDEDGTPRMPSIVIHPSMADKLKAMLEDPETTKRVAAIMLKKRAERSPK